MEDQISYADLYARWERGNWQATEIDFSADRDAVARGLHRARAPAALWNYSMFFHGEDAVADDLAPFIDAAPREEQKYFLATQQVDEARHSVFFHRFMHEVVERGDGTIAGALRATEPELTWGFRRTFEMLDEVTGELRKDRSRTALARAVTMYHFIVEATLAQPGQHFIEDYLERRELLPGFREGMQHVAQDEQRHIGFGVKLLHDLATEDPVEVPEAVADLLREVFPVSVAVFVPPGLKREYTECFGFTLEEIYTEGARSFESKLRMAGLPLESLPGPQVYPYDLPVEERATRALAMLRAGYLGEKNGGAARDPESMALLFDSVRRAVDPRTAPEGPMTLQWEFPDAEPWHLRLDNGSTAAAPGRAPDPDVELQHRLRRLGRRDRRAAGPEAGRRHPAAEAEGLAAGALAGPQGLLGPRRRQAGLDARLALELEPGRTAQERLPQAGGIHGSAGARRVLAVDAALQRADVAGDLPLPRPADQVPFAADLRAHERHLRGALGEAHEVDVRRALLEQVGLDAAADADAHLEAGAAEERRVRLPDGARVEVDVHAAAESAVGRGTHRKPAVDVAEGRRRVVRVGVEVAARTRRSRPGRGR